MQAQAATADGEAVGSFVDGNGRAGEARAAVAWPPGFAVGCVRRRDEPGSVQRCLAVFL